MNAVSKQRFRLANAEVRMRASAAIWQAPEGWEVAIRPPGRSLDQSAMFHALCDDVAKSGVEWAGCRRTPEEWKQLLIVSHAVATQRPVELVPNLEDGAPVNIRESTALMSKERMSSLLEYSIAWAVSHGVKLKDRAYAA